MTDTNNSSQHDSLTLRDALNALVKYWPILLLLGGAYAGGVKLYLDVDTLKERKDAEVRQWQKLGEHDNKISIIEDNVDDIDEASKENKGDIKKLWEFYWRIQTKRLDGGNGQ